MAKEDKIADVVEASLPDDAGYEYVQVGDVKHHRGDMSSKRWAKVKAHYEKDSDWVKSKNADGTITAKAEPSEAKASPPPSTIDPDNEMELGGPGVDNTIKPSSVPTDAPVTGAKGGSGLNKIGEWADSTRMGGATPNTVDITTPLDTAHPENIDPNNVSSVESSALTPEENALADTARALPGATTESLPQKTTATPAGEAAPVEGLADKINNLTGRVNKVGLGMALGGPVGAIYAATPSSPEAPEAMGVKNAAPTPEVNESSAPMPEMPSPVGAQAALVTPGQIPQMSDEERTIRDDVSKKLADNEALAADKQREYLTASAKAQEAAAIEGKHLAEQAAEVSRLRTEAADKSERYMAARTATLEEASRRASQGLDPDRFWNSRDTGQKVAAVVAGALFGFNNQGMQWLQRLDTLVQNDVRMQESDRESAVSGLKAKAAGYFDAAKFALENGAYKGETLALAAAARWKAIEIQFSNVKAKSDDMAVIERANTGMQAAAEFQTKNLEIARQIGERQVKMDYDAGVANAGHRTAVNLANAHAANQFAIAKYKAGASQNALTKGSAALRGKVGMLRGTMAELESVIRKAEKGDYVGNVVNWAASSAMGDAVGKIVPTVAEHGEGEISARQQAIMRATKAGDLYASNKPQVDLAMEAAKDLSPGGSAVFAKHLRGLQHSVYQTLRNLENVTPNLPEALPIQDVPHEDY